MTVGEYEDGTSTCSSPEEKQSIAEGEKMYEQVIVSRQ